MSLSKMLSGLLAFSVIGFQMLPAIAYSGESNYVFDVNNINSVSTSKTLVHANNVIPLVFVNEFNANESHVGKIVKFKLDKTFTDSDGDVLPSGTVFYGKVDDLTKSKMGFRKASAHISINKMIMPDGKEYIVDVRPDKETLTSPVSANVAKGAATTVAAAGVGMVGAIVIAVECLSIGGIILAPYTGAAVGIALAGTSKGVNFIVPAGTKIMVKFNKPVDVYDL